MKKILIGNVIYIFVFLLTALEANENCCKLYCFYTPQYEDLYEKYFLPSIKDDFEIIALKFEQECPMSTYRSSGWEKTMYRKLQILREAILNHWGGRIFFYSDVDIIFLRSVIKVALFHLSDCDLAIQQSWPYPKVCAGFFVMRGSEKTLNLVETAIKYMGDKICFDDQTALRMALEHTPKEMLSWTFLPSSQFPNGRRVLKGFQKGNKSLYQKDIEINIDDSILLFHANCSVGLDNKIDFLHRVQQEFEKGHKIENNL